MQPRFTFQADPFEMQGEASFMPFETEEQERGVGARRSGIFRPKLGPRPTRTKIPRGPKRRLIPWRPRPWKPGAIRPIFPWRPFPVRPHGRDRYATEPMQPNQSEPSDSTSGAGGGDTASQQTPPPVPQCQQPLVLDGFDVGSARVKPKHTVALKKIAEGLTQLSQNIVLTIEGHTDGSPQDAANKALSQQRALAVGKYFADAGITVETTTQALHHTQPITSGTSPEERAKNRRVVVRTCERPS